MASRTLTLTLEPYSGRLDVCGQKGSPASTTEEMQDTEGGVRVDSCRNPVLKNFSERELPAG